MTPAAEIEHYQLAARLAGLEIREFATPEMHHVVLREMRFHYLDWGTRGKTPMLFLHGGGQTARTWDIVCLAVRPDFHCLALDQRGHGDSEWSYVMDYAPETHAADIAAFVDRLGLERFILIGMSMGCINGLHYAINHPERLAAFVAVDTGPAVCVAGGTRIIDFRERTAQLDSVDAFVAQAMRFNPRRDPRLLRWSVRHNLRQLPNGKWTWKTDQRGRLDAAALVQRLQVLWDHLHKIRCPVLVVRGAESDVFLNAQAQRFASALPDGRWVRVDGAGHTVQGDNPKGLVDALTGFLRDTGIAN